MKSHRCFSIFCFILFPVLIGAQTTLKQKGTSGTNKSSARVAVDPIIAERRQLAISLLNSLSVEARSYRDESLRARVQSRVADVLWDEDQDTARSLFRRAWEAAEAVELQAQAPTSGLSFPGRKSNRPSPRPRTNLRAEILRLAARRDRALGEEFLAKMTTAGKDQTERANRDSTNNSEPLSQAEIAERLRLAQEFLESDNVERAIQFADPALSQISMSAISFLVSLRDKNAAIADQRFANLLGRAAADNTTDANTVSLLTTYVFTPSTYLTVSDTGIPSSMSYPPHPAPDISAALRADFFKAAANILLRPFSQIDQSSAGRAGTYFISTRLYPLFQQYAPDLAPRVSAQLAALGPQASQATGTSSDWVNQGMAPDDPTGDGIGDELRDRLSHAQNAEARDRAYAFAAMKAAEAADPRAQEFADKIEDFGTRTAINNFVDYKFIGALLKKGKIDEALELARKNNLSHVHRAHVLTQAAGLLAKTDRARSTDLLAEALTEIRRIDAATPERAYGLVAVLAQISAIDRVRGWDLLDETIKAANTVEDFTGENGNVSSFMGGKLLINLWVEMAKPGDIPEAFATLAEDDVYRAVNVAKSFKGEAPRALATLAVARSVLQAKQTKASR